jgi:hypothetical protein
MIARYNTLSFIWGVPGLIIQMIGIILRVPNTPVMQQGRLVSSNPFMFNLGLVIILGGTILLLIGFAYYAKAKGRNPWWCLCALLSLIGLIILACLKDRTIEVVKKE